MSAVLTHLAVGLLLGVALRLPLKYLPLAALMGAAADFDQLGKYAGVPLLKSRVHGHNVLVLVVLPVLTYVYLTWRGARTEHRQLAAASPVLLSSHLFVDLVQFEPIGAGGSAALLWPFSSTFFTLEYRLIGEHGPAQYSVMSLILLSLALATLCSIVAFRLADERERLQKRRHATAIAGAYAVAWIILLPALAIAGPVTERVDHPNASLSLSGVELHLPYGRLIATTLNQGGFTAGAGTLTLQVIHDGQVIAEGKNANPIKPHGRGGFDIGLPEGRHLDRIDVILVATKDPATTYASARATTVRSHIDVPLQAKAERDGGLTAATKWSLQIHNAGSESIPPGAVRATLLSGSSTLLEETNTHIIFADGTWTLHLNQPAAVEARLVVRAVDDGHVYLDQTVKFVAIN